MVSRNLRRNPLNANAKYFDCHFHIIDKNFPVVPNQGFMPDAFTSEDYLERLKAVDLCGGAVVSGTTGAPAFWTALPQPASRSAAATPATTRIDRA